MNGAARNIGLGLSVANKTIFLPNNVSSFEPSGRLKEGALPEQQAQQEQVIHTLPVAHAAVAARGVRRAFVAKVMQVKECWPDGKTKMTAVRRLMERLREIRPYLFRPAEVTAEEVTEPDTPVVVVENSAFND